MRELPEVEAVVRGPQPLLAESMPQTLIGIVPLFPIMRDVTLEWRASGHEGGATDEACDAVSAAPGLPVLVQALHDVLTASRVLPAGS